MSAGDNLDFFSGINHLGQVEDSFGWFWQVEIRGTVAGDASKWFLGQRKWASHSGQERDLLLNEVFTLKVPIIRDAPDNPAAQFRQQLKGQSKFFFIDAPGPFKSQYPRVSTVSVQNFYTYVERGKSRCGFKWSLVTVIENNRLSTQVLLPQHFPLK
jgi:hypothetical protein